MSGRVRWAVFVVALVVAAPTVVWASHQFVDVPDNHVFHDDIAWLADNGVTLGCNPPDNDRFCPEDEVTRGEMAAFMRRLAEGGVVDARTVGGLTADQVGVMTGNAITDEGFSGDTGTELFTVEVVAPRDGGALTLTADVAVDTEGGGGVFWTEIDNGSCNEDREIPRNSQSGFWVASKGSDSASVTWLMPVTRGRHNVSMCLWSTNDGRVLTSSVSASWSPRVLSTTNTGSTAVVAPADLVERMRDAATRGGQG